MKKAGRFSTNAPLRTRLKVFQIGGGKVVFQIVPGQIAVDDRIDIGWDGFVCTLFFGVMTGKFAQWLPGSHHAHLSVIGFAFSFVVFTLP